MAEYSTRRFAPGDAAAVAELARRNLLEVNIRDYPAELMDRLAAMYTEEYVLDMGRWAHSHVVCRGGVVVGCGSVAPFWGREETESVLLTVFALPELHGAGVGRRIMTALESDPFFLRAKRVEVPASLTARGFYEKLGYRYMEGGMEPDETGCYHMEKRR